MTAQVLPQGKQSFETAAGLPAVGWKLYTTDTGTNNPRTTWQDSAQVTPNANPIVMDARGEAVIFWSGTYRVRLEDNLGNTIWTVDGVSYVDPTSTLLADLATANNGSKGAGMIGFGAAITYLANTVGAFLNLVFGRATVEITAGITPTNYQWPVGTIQRYGATGNGAADDSAAFVAAATLSALGLQIKGVPGSIYKIASQITLGSAFNWDGCGSTIKFSGTSNFTHPAPAATATTTVSSGATQGSVSVVVASATGLVVGQYFSISATNFPTHWGIIKNIVGTTITLSSSLPFDYSGTINFSARNVASLGTICWITNTIFDGSLTTGGVPASSGNVVYAGGFLDIRMSGCRITNYTITDISAVLVQYFVSLDCEFSNNTLANNEVRNSSDVLDVQDCRSMRCVNNNFEGSHFGADFIRCGRAVAVGNTLQGRRNYERSQAVQYSVRGFKFTTCATAHAIGNQIDEYESAIRVDNGFRWTIVSNSLRNCDRTSSTNTTGIAISVAAASTATEFGGIISGNVLENCGGLAIGIDNGAAGGEGRCIVSGNYIRVCNAQAIWAHDRNITVMGNIIEDWDLAGLGVPAVHVDDGGTYTGNRFHHSIDPTKVCFLKNFTATYVYDFRDNASPTGNPMFVSGQNFEASGTDNIATGTTAKIINHGLVKTPTVDEITITFTNNSTNDPGGYPYITAIGASQFTVNCRADPGASGLSFGWRVIEKQPFTA